MFPNFESLAQREKKRQELLERVDQRVRQAKAKREMYDGAQWASDTDKTISLKHSPIKPLRDQLLELIPKQIQKSAFAL